ncbi:NAD(P)-binding domain-containing protein, partial [Streptomyces sp. NPDC058953]|uniref:lactate/malate family dehydrogenase n=1 Tax=Streptomyces sp. NPDC058953 TaxID=3346676 RepID=UPI00369400FF
MNRRIGTVGIIGAGAVGHTVATLITAAGWCEKLLIASGSDRSAEALVTDLDDMAQVIASPVRVETTDVSAMRGCDALVICPRAKFTNTAERDVRMAGLTANAPLIASLGRRLTGYTGAAIVVTNPVDVMTRLFAEASGAARVYGVGSGTDSARYRLALANLLAVPVTSVEGRVVGEHGDHAVVCATATRVGGAGRLRQQPTKQPANSNPPRHTPPSRRPPWPAPSAGTGGAGRTRPPRGGRSRGQARQRSSVSGGFAG